MQEKMPSDHGVMLLQYSVNDDSDLKSLGGNWRSANHVEWSVISISAERIEIN
jgi:hypothetical protein